jgi:phage shock protein A
MSTFMQKLRVVTLGSVNDLLNKAIDMNSPSVLRQYVRDLEDALDRMKDEAAIEAGGIRTLERESQDLQTKIDVGKKTIVQLQQAGHDDLARIKATEIVQLQQQYTSHQNMLVTQRQSSSSIDQSISKLELRHSSMVSKLQELTRLDMDTKAKEHTAMAMAAAGRLANTGADISVDDVEQKMRARNDVATEKFNRAMGDIQFQEDPETTAAVDDLLGSLKPATAAAGK